MQVYQQTLHLILYGLLSFAVVSLWVTPKRVWSLRFLGASLAISFYLGLIDISGLLALVVLGSLIYVFYSYAHFPLLKLLLGCVIAVLTIGFYLHRIPGFHNWLMINNLVFAEDSMPYRFYLNLDKISAALFFLVCGVPLNRRFKDWAKSFVGALTPLALAIMILLVISLALHYVRFNPKLPAITGVWIVSNLLFVVVAEETFFRGFIQRQLVAVFQKIPQGSAIAIFIAAILFGMLHYSGGPTYMGLATIAGCIYGYAYARTGRLESAIFTHFGLNLVHFLFFSYPALK